MVIAAETESQDSPSLRGGRVTRVAPFRTLNVRNRAYRARMAIARYPSIVIDCPDPKALATFYAALLDWKADISSDWADVRADYGQCLSFQQVADYAPPQWPTQQAPQQMHIDVIVDDLDTAEKAVLDLGATKHEHQPGTKFRVFLDPAGHPFCLCLD
jgi:predicted enzyme related to lactoylglutathione lyase